MKYRLTGVFYELALFWRFLNGRLYDESSWVLGLIFFQRFFLSKNEVFESVSKFLRRSANPDFEL